MSNPYDPISDRELLIRIDERARFIQQELSRHLEQDEMVHADLSTRLSKMEAFRTGVVMLAGFITVVAGTAAAFATNLF